MPTVTIRDESLGAAMPRATDQAGGGLVLDFLTERVTVREVIRARVYQEVDDYNRRRPEHFQGLVEPTDAERTLNGFKLKTGREIDWKRQFEAACEAYARNAFLILVDDKQAGPLDQQVTLRAGSEVTFLRMVPLVGG
ncbi:MAG TPA: hypothetical protein VFF69_09810 [Phycisphaerales bacterium]|nr:hypothetical protein [Phycisphaerales bacterium]